MVPWLGFELRASAGRIKPLYMGCLLYQQCPVSLYVFNLIALYVTDYLFIDVILIIIFELHSGSATTFPCVNVYSNNKDILT